MSKKEFFMGGGSWGAGTENETGLGWPKRAEMGEWEKVHGNVARRGESSSSRRTGGEGITLFYKLFLWAGGAGARGVGSGTQSVSDLTRTKVHLDRILFFMFVKIKWESTCDELRTGLESDELFLCCVFALHEKRIVAAQHAHV
jgi:hypothetical protein